MGSENGIRTTAAQRFVTVKNRIVDGDVGQTIAGNFEQTAREFPLPNPDVIAPPVFVYTWEDDGDFLATCHPISSDLALDGDTLNAVATRKLEGAKCAFLVPVGSLHDVPHDDAMRLATERGMRKLTELREVYVDFKGGQSNENVIELQVVGE